MTAKRRPRQHDQATNQHARNAARALQRAEARLAKAEAARDDAMATLSRLLAETERRFGIEVPADAYLLDVLACVEVEDGEVWRWHGMRNNHGLPVIKSATSERSVVRYLALAFGVIAADQFGTLYPTGEVDDVNPWHRQLRASEEATGQKFRFRRQVAS